MVDYSSSDVADDSRPSVDQASSHLSICRVCANFCSVAVDVQEGRIGRIAGDRANPIYAGYRCQKGAEQRSEYGHPDRLHRSMKRRDDGSFVAVPLADAVGDIASRLRRVIDDHGPRSLAMYVGSYFGFHAQNNPFAGAFMKAVGSPMSFSPVTIDQPGKATAAALHGHWQAPDQSLDAPRVALYVGTNPIVSHQGRLGPPQQLLRDFEDWGTDLIVIDPRRTEFARKARLHLQIRPGSDVAVLAGMIRVILVEQLFDTAFVAQETTGCDALRAAVEPFTPATVAARAGIDVGDLESAARRFAQAGRGYYTAGTGANMSGDGTAVEYLLLCLTSLCGYWSRAGDRLTSTVTLLPFVRPVAQAAAPTAAVDDRRPLRVRGLSRSAAGMPSAALPEEILTPGEGRVRALLSLGGSPATTLPDHGSAVRALRSLDVLVHSDIHLSPTARLADYVIATKLPFEVVGTTLLPDSLPHFSHGWGYRRAYAQYTPALVEPPEGSEVVEPWEFLFDLARELGLPLALTPGFGALQRGAGRVPLDMDVRPTSDEILDIVHTGSRVPLDEVRGHSGGRLYPVDGLEVAAKEAGWTGRLHLGAGEALSGLAQHAAARPPAADRRFVLVARRARHVMNTPALAYPGHTARHNPLLMHPEDLGALGLAPGDTVELRSGRGCATAVAAADDTLRRGTVSLTHGFGGLTGDSPGIGTNPNELVGVDDHHDPLTGQPRMTALPVDILPSSRRTQSARRHEAPPTPPQFEETTSVHTR